MRHLLDTNQWSYFQAGNPLIVDRLRALPSEAIAFMSVASQAELLSGIELVEGERRRNELTRLYYQTIERVTEILPITSAVAEEFARNFAELRRKGRPIETNNLWIAATARVHALTLVTSDRHFQYVDGLKIEDWTAPADAEGAADQEA